MPPPPPDISAMRLWKIVGTPDLNGDGKSDIVLQNQISGAIYYWIINSTYTGVAKGGFLWNPSSLNPEWKVVGFGKINTDQIPDVVMQHQTSNVVHTFLLGWNGSSVTVLTDGAIANPPAGYKVVGVSRLGGNISGGVMYSDLLLYNASTGQPGAYYLAGTLSLPNANGSTFFTFGFALGSGWSVVGNPNLNTNDNIDDILFRNNSTGLIGYWVLNGVYGNGMLNSTGSLGVPSDPGNTPGNTALILGVVGTSPLDGDGKADVIFQQTDFNAPYFWKLTLPNTGSGGVSALPQWMIARP